MLKINIHEAKTHLSRYAKRVKAGETILVCERNVPFAELRPIPKERTAGKIRPIGLDAGKVKLPEDWDSKDTNKSIAEMFQIGNESC